MAKACVVALSALSLCMSVIAQPVGHAAASSGRPKFAQPRFAQTKQCGQIFEATLTEDRETLSLLKIARLKSDKDFLVVGTGHGRRAQSRCGMEIRLEQALARPEILIVDVRGSEEKEPDTRISYVIGIGRQAHAIAYARGRWLDGPTEAKRFQVPLAAGTKTFRIKLEGEAVSLDGKATAFVALDSLDLCIVDPASPDGCAHAAGGQPGTPATPAGVQP